ncbi:hypothetical protein lerEdw1_003859 [Lerista edwardsae]|nr:hypothetical protein lerEdw1_003859 [Lerista edwardsae]
MAMRLRSFAQHGNSIKKGYVVQYYMDAFGSFGQACTGTCKVELAATSDGQTIVCYHPSLDIPYEHTRPIPQLDPVNYKEETHDQVLKSRLEVKELKNKKGPTIEELSKMFYTTKHRWYPVGHVVFSVCLVRVKTSGESSGSSDVGEVEISQPYVHREGQGGNGEAGRWGSVAAAAGASPAPAIELTRPRPFGRAAARPSGNSLPPRQ